MGKVIIQPYTVKNPITLIGYEAGVCCGADVTNDDKNYKRGIECINNQHGRTLEFPDVYMILDGYSARVIREWYTHIGGLPTRLQASTRYIPYKYFEYIIPDKIKHSPKAIKIYEETMANIADKREELENAGIDKEDSALLLPLGMTTKIVCKHNARNLIDMSHQRMCGRAYWEYQELFRDLRNALVAYSPEWKTLVESQFQPKCEFLGYCPEKNSCGRVKRRTR